MTAGLRRGLGRRPLAAAFLPLLLGACNLTGAVAPAPMGARYGCAEFAFDPTPVDQPGSAERDDDPRSAALRDHLARDGEPKSLPDTGWHLIDSDARRAEFGTWSVNGYSFVVLEQREGAWAVASSGGCELELVMIGGAKAARWELAPGFGEPAPDATSITVLVSERGCASGKPPGDRIVGPQVVAEAAVIRIAFGVRPLPGAQECQESPPGRVVIDLGQPIGNRQISDFGLWPPVIIWAPS